MNRIIVFSGPPLSGKSTLAAAYGTESNVPVLEMDSIRLRLMPNSRQSREDRNIAYGSLHYVETTSVSEPAALAMVVKYLNREKPLQSPDQWADCALE